MLTIFRPLLLFVCVSMLFALAHAAGADQGQVLAQARDDLRSSIERLANLRSGIRQERIPLAKDLNRLELELSKKRRQSMRINRLRDSLDHSLAVLEQGVAKKQEEIVFAQTLLTEFWRGFESGIDVAELPTYQSQLGAVRRVLEMPEASPSERLEVLSALVLKSIERLQNVVGGKRFTGHAITSDGLQVAGIFAVLGPLTYFTSVSGEAGLSGQSASLNPLLLSIDEDSQQGIRQVMEEGNGSFPIDVSLGDAMVYSDRELSWLSHIQQGGVWMYPILFLALLSLIVAIVKAVEIYRIRFASAELIHKLLTALTLKEFDEAERLVESVAEPYASMLKNGVHHSSEDKAYVEEIMYESILELQPKLESKLSVLAITAGTAPLLGLLGTVTGMISTFQLISIFGSGDAQVLSGGISEALITTEYGLIVAIPALILHAMFSRRSQAILAHMEKMMMAFVNGLQSQKA